VKILVAYASKHGSTEGIAAAIAARLIEDGHDATAARVTDAGEIGGVHAIVLGSAVYAGSWMKEALEWAQRQAGSVADRPVWLFSSGPLGVEVHDEEEQPRQLPELTDLLNPREHRIFYGALDKNALGFAERMMVKAVKAPEGDFRDWDAIRAWADEISAAVG
jgi:menaquinone-dependent protoporphyrinogen oxidase